MSDYTVAFEDQTLNKTTIQEGFDKLAPEIRNAVYALYGTHLEAFPKELLDYSDEICLILEKLQSRSEKTQKIILMRLGLLTVLPLSREEIGAEFGITGERVRQIESSFFKTLRSHITHRDRFAKFF